MNEEKKEAGQDKLSFGMAIGGDESKMGDDCYRYGSISGCDDCCPQLRRGECPVPFENKDIIEGDEELEYLYNVN